MSASDETTQRGALARSIEDLFRTHEDDGAEGEGTHEAVKDGPADAADGAPSEDATAQDATLEDATTEDASAEVPRADAPAGRAPAGADAEAPAAPDPEVVEAPPDGAPSEEDEGPVDEPREAGPADPQQAPATAAEPRGASPEAAELAEAAEDYLRADPAARPAQRERILALAAELKDRGDVAPVVDAVETLATVGDLGDFGRDDALDLCEELLGPTTATLLCDRLGRLREEDDREARLRRAARLGPAVADAAGDMLAESEDWGARRVYIDLLIAMQDEGMRVVTEMLEDSRWYVVRNAVHILGEAQGEEVVQHLTAGLGHDDARVRKETILALAKVGGEDAEALVSNKVDDPEPSVREAAARAIGVLGVERAVRPLLEQLDEEGEPDVQIAIMRALGQLGDPGAVPALEKRATGGFFGRSPTPVRVAAYRALGAIGTPHARGLVEQAVEDKDPEVRAAATSLVRPD